MPMIIFSPCFNAAMALEGIIHFSYVIGNGAKYMKASTIMPPSTILICALLGNIIGNVIVVFFGHLASNQYMEWQLRQWAVTIAS
jgi:hypothetical protein